MYSKIFTSIAWYFDIFSYHKYYKPSRKAVQNLFKQKPYAINLLRRRHPVPEFSSVAAAFYVTTNYFKNVRSRMNNC